MLVWQDVLALCSSTFTSRNTKTIIAFIGVIFIKKIYPKVTGFVVFMGPFRIKHCDFTNIKEDLAIPRNNLINRIVIIAFYFNVVERLVRRENFGNMFQQFYI